MRRILFVLILLGLIGAGIWWFFLRLTPEKALRAAFQNLSKAETVRNVEGTLFWSLREQGNGGLILDKWLSFAGSLDLHDPSRIQGSGVIGLSETGSEGDFQTADVVLSKDRAAFRLRESGEEITQWFEEASGTSTEDTWFDFDRDVLFKKEMGSDWVAVGNDADLRQALRGADLDGWAAIANASERTESGRRVLDIELRPNEEGVKRGLVSLMNAWFLQNPSGAQLDWASRASTGIAGGSWTVTIDIETRTFREIRGSWPVYDKEGRETARVSADIRLAGWNAAVSVTAPETAVDVTDAIDHTGPGSLPSAGERDQESE